MRTGTTSFRSLTFVNFCGLRADDITFVRVTTPYVPLIGGRPVLCWAFVKKEHRKEKNKR
jgi:hypothetical protein